VPVVVESCEHSCGPGELRCEDGRWGECEPLARERECASVCGAGIEVCDEGEWHSCNAPLPLPPLLEVTLRDFSEAHPDFEEQVGMDLGLVEERLGADGKPVYAGGRKGSRTTTGALNFDQWFRDVPGVNQALAFELQLRFSPRDSRMFTYDGRSFFPLDGQLFGNEGRLHNFHFTLEAVTAFDYVGGEVFSFSGDDDVWVFVNGLLVIDLGGVHASQTARVAIDDVVNAAGLVRGNRYPLHIFFAERHTNSSNFVIDTSISARGDCPAP
jgi:fibro-slime domain-containing protein